MRLSCTAVTLLLDRHQPIEFSLLSRCIRAAIETPLHSRRVRKLQGGPGVVFRTLLMQMELPDPPLHWAPCLRDLPKISCEVVWVVNDPEDLKWAVRNRSRLKARQLWAGPNIVVVPQEAEGVLTRPEIDRIIVPAKWVADVYSRECPDLRPKISIWPAAIDTNYWAAEDAPKMNWIIYNKYQDSLAAHIARVLESRNAKFIQMNYGQYTRDKYRELLKSAKGLVWLSRSESQGIALLEALSMDIPALVWDPGNWKYHSPELKREFTACATSAPYFSERCGLRFTAGSEFEPAFKTFSEGAGSYHPRDYILKSGLDLRTNKEQILALISDEGSR